MPPERHPPDSSQEWLNRAQSNLVQAKGVQPGVYLEDLCFQAQQAVEKALKAILLHRAGTFPYVHDIAQLIGLLEQEEDEEIPQRVRQAARLNGYAVDARYPGVSEPVDREEYREALELAEDVVRWVGDKLEGASGSSDG